MEIREATDKDIAEILKVLKASLGETSSKKTETVWCYKHIDNPFGRSLVLVAEEENEIVGVRAFMRWQWQRGNENFSAFRAVDTATHPEHQGKGIFKKLTLRALEIAKSNGDHFVFNTPNEQSRPGYLKMGWEIVSSLKVAIKPVNPIYWRNSVVNTYSIDIQAPKNSLNDVTENVNAKLRNTNKIFTPKTPEYLKWRYENNPLQNYLVKATNDFYIAGYVKNHSKIRELRIVEIITSSELQPKSIKCHINHLARKFGVQIVSFAPNTNLKFRWSFIGKFGPILTLRNINLIEDRQNNFLNIDNWAYSLGDLELF